MTHPLRNIRPAFLGDKLEDACMGMGVLCAVDEFEHDRPLDMQPRHLVEGGRWQEDLGTMVKLRSLGSRGHDERVAPIVFVESLGARPSGASAVKHLVHVLPVIGVGGVVRKLRAGPRELEPAASVGRQTSVAIWERDVIRTGLAARTMMTVAVDCGGKVSAGSSREVLVVSVHLKAGIGVWEKSRRT